MNDKSGLPDLVGQTFHRLTVERFSHRDDKRFPYWACRCSCGGEKTVQHYNLIRGNSRSCGCLQKERASQARFKHGMSNHPGYSVWAGMGNRCNNPNGADFVYYGERGIRVMWLTFDDFWRDMGPTWSQGLTIERNDVNGHYEASNCRWIPLSKQSHNRRNSRMIDTPWGLMSAPAAAEKCGIPYRTFIQRVQANWGMDKLFNQKVRMKRNRATLASRLPQSSEEQH